MEDLATDRIYRLMIAQRILHRDALEITDEAEGRPVKHTPELITRLFDEELDRLLNELPPDTDSSISDKFRQARQISEGMIVRGEFTPV